VSIFKQITHKAGALKGGAKKIAGQITGSRRQRATGHSGKATGNFKQAAAKTKDAFRH
jgi:uncharacterized protein YjbJ (UPF0337 family)